VLFTAPVKQDLSVALKQKFEDRLIRIPVDKAIRESHHAVRKIMTSAGNPRFDADRSEVGHADEYWAHALAVHAAIAPVTPIEFQSAGAPRLAYQLEDYTL
jgi:phage FluMu gp28-like protein